MASGVKRWPALTMTLPSLPTRSMPVSWRAISGSSQAIVRLTLRYGVSMKPYGLIRPKVASEPMRPMFGPSGVSIGQMRP